jgi:hypothetical protein
MVINGRVWCKRNDKRERKNVIEEEEKSNRARRIVGRQSSDI